MNVHELPMILFTVLSQMAVGAFVALGVVQLYASARYDRRVVDRLADPALLAIGPTLVAGLLASMLHMNDPFNALNVIRHVGSSWLSREIVFGVGFAALGFLYFVMQWRGWGSTLLRQILAAITAFVGLGLVWCQSMIYYTLVTVPGWNHWATPLRFFVTTVLLGSLAVGVAMVAATSSHRAVAATEVNQRLVHAETDGEVQQMGGKLGTAVATLTRQTTLTDEQHAQADQLVRQAIRVISLLTAVTAMVLLIALPLYLNDLAAHPSQAASQSAAVYQDVFFLIRMVLLAVGAVVLALVLHRMSGVPSVRARALTTTAFLALVITFAGEIMARSMFYDTIVRIGM